MKSKSFDRLMWEDKILTKLCAFVTSKRDAVRKELYSRMDFSVMSMINSLKGKTIAVNKKIVDGRECYIAEIVK